jgi:ribosomal protein L24E
MATTSDGIYKAANYPAGISAVLVLGVVSLLALGCARKPEPVPGEITAEVGGEQALLITEPLDGENVGEQADVKGRTTYPDLNHYVVVIPVLHPAKWVQRWPVFIEADGTLSSTAQFGEGNIGVKEDFKILLLATSKELEPAKLRQEPPDARWSDPVTVTRTH